LRKGFLFSFFMVLLPWSIFMYSLSISDMYAIGMLELFLMLDVFSCDM
jgi:hypothetical protein